jgi:DNA polymerase-3 subunit epsilon
MKLSPNHKLALATGAALAVIAGMLIAAVMVMRSAAESGSEDVGAPLFVIGAAAGALVFAILQPLVNLLFRAPMQLAEETRILIGDSSRRVKPVGGAELQAVAAAINELAGRRQAFEQDVAAEIARSQENLEADRNRLAVLMAELQQSVVVCNLDGRILLYNQRAREVLSAGVGGELVGLGRSLYAVFERSLIAHALDQVGRRLDADERLLQNS